MTTTESRDEEKILREYVGFVLRHLREERGATQRDAGRRMNYSNSLVAMVEVGMRLPSPEFLNAFGSLFGCSGLAKASLKLLATKNHTWLGRACPELEWESESLMYWAPQILPDFLQTEEYAHEIRSQYIPVLSRKQMEEAEEERIRRNRMLLAEDRLPTVVVLDESVLRRSVGSEDIMRRQLKALSEWAGHPAVGIQVMPFRSSSYVGLLRPVTVAMHEGSRQLLAYVENHVGSTLVHEASEVGVLTQHFGNLRAHALPPGESEDLIAQSVWKR